ncbi:MAG TPA: hypothetical protein IAA69_07475 [Candidatus Aveggerthella stercoripullorum]|uniref:Uncharacterized protein n=1 Tax=Candidatus Aveggerthella stercoripullorum TaxID=2840688 RepID=A0A9D1A379_9ACTN|nr:hypothetical protein [Candidatus Aveggerthella stercoripullorum]
MVAGVLTVAYAALILRAGARRRARLDSGELDPKEFDTLGAWDGVEEGAPKEAQAFVSTKRIAHEKSLGIGALRRSRANVRFARCGALSR